MYLHYLNLVLLYIDYVMSKRCREQLGSLVGPCFPNWIHYRLPGAVSLVPLFLTSYYIKASSKPLITSSLGF